MSTKMPVRALILGAVLGLWSCSERTYDDSTPQAALDSMRQMAVDGRADLMAGVLHIEARDITYADGVTEASAIGDVLKKTGDMLGQLYRVAMKLRQRFPDEIQKAAASVEAKPAGEGRDRGFDGRVFGSAGLERFMVDPFGLLDEQRARLSVQDLGDGTAAVLLDAKPMFGGLGLMMREVDGHWKVEIPIAMLRDYRPNTRQEWSVVASMMLGIEGSLTEFEQELDQNKVRNLEQAAERAGRMLFESAAVQAWLYQQMKHHADDAPADSKPG